MNILSATEEMKPLREKMFSLVKARTSLAESAEKANLVLRMQHQTDSEASRMISETVKAVMESCAMIDAAQDVLVANDDCCDTTPINRPPGFMEVPKVSRTARFLKVLCDTEREVTRLLGIIKDWDSSLGNVDYEQKGWLVARMVDIDIQIIKAAARKVRDALTALHKKVEELAGE